MDPGNDHCRGNIHGKPAAGTGAERGAAVEVFLVRGNVIDTDHRYPVAGGIRMMIHAGGKRECNDVYAQEQ